MRPLFVGKITSYYQLLNSNVRQIMIRKWLLPVIFILGFLLGAFCFYSYLQRALFIEKANQLTSGREYSMFNTMLFSIEADEADKQLNNQNKEVSIYALTRSLDNIELLTVQNVYPTCALRAYKLAKYHIRLAELYSDKNDFKSQKMHILSAEQYFERMGFHFENSEDINKISSENYSNDFQVVRKKYAKKVEACS